jgi:Zn-dependent protease
MDTILLALVWYLIFIVSTTAHEAAHALVARWLGDPTAYYGGQVTLNPLPHIRREPIGTILVPLVSFFYGASAGHPWMMGWASAPFDPHWASRHPQRAAWMAAAGPATNLLLALLAVLAIRLGMVGGIFEPGQRYEFPYVTAAAPDVPRQFAEFVSIVFVLNWYLCLFNLFPLPPLDGSAIVQLFMSRGAAARWQNAIHQPGLGLIGLVAAWILFGSLTPRLHLLGLKLIYPTLTYEAN